MQESVLLVGSTDKSRELLQALLPPAACAAARIGRSGAEARRMCAAADFDLILINTPLSDESGLELAMEAARQSIAGILLLVKADLAETVASRVEPCGVMVLPKPVSRQMFEQTLRFMEAARCRMALLKAENDRLEKKLSELRLIDRAKCVLIQYLGMTEDQAHRQIEKQAMDTRRTKAEISRDILSTYEL